MARLREITLLHIRKLMVSDNPDMLLRDLHAKGYDVAEYLLMVLNRVMSRPPKLRFRIVRSQNGRSVAFVLGGRTLIFDHDGLGFRLRPANQSRDSS